MSDTDTPQEPRHRRKRKDPAPPVFFIALILLLLAILGGGAYYLISPEKADETGIETEPQVVFEEPLDTVPVIEQEPETESIPLETEPVTEEIEEPGLAGPIIESEEEKLERECGLLADKLHTFFTHIDNKEYIAPFELHEPSQAYFTTLAYKLLDNPPVVSRESDDLYTILKNMAHFFRVIGKDNILLMKTILDRERDKIEDVASELYQWTSINSCRSNQFNFRPELSKVYEYAGFFLNTMGGRSYLFRRDSRSRLLVNYYSILIVEIANEKGLNRHGIDISLLIPQLINEIESSNQLIYKENYLDQLYNLLEKYQ